jgi:RecB family endonuclease NucS
MPLYEITPNEIKALEPTTFARHEIGERSHLQQLLRESIEIIAPDTLIIAEEFSEWEDSKRRVDLLGIDSRGNLVAIELKRTEDGGHMDLQAIRYAAMVSAIGFSKAVEIFGRYLKENRRTEDARKTLLEFLGWETDSNPDFG